MTETLLAADAAVQDSNTTVKASTRRAEAAKAKRRAALDDAVSSNIDIFAGNLQTARDLWKRYPGLVELEALPEPFRSAQQERDERGESRGDYGDTGLIKAGLLTPKSNLPAGFQVFRVPEEPESQDAANLDLPLIVRQARGRAQKLAAEGLLADVQDGYDSFVQWASAPDLHVLAQALHHGSSNNSLVEGFLWSIGLEVPGESADAPASSEPETHSETEPRKPLTLQQIRAIRRDSSSDADQQKQALAKAFTVDDASDDEREMLTVCRAIYQHLKEVRFDNNAPAEKFIKKLLSDISRSPLTVDDIETELEDLSDDFNDRAEAFRALSQEQEECS